MRPTPRNQSNVQRNVDVSDTITSFGEYKVVLGSRDEKPARTRRLSWPKSGPIINEMHIGAARF